MTPPHLTALSDQVWAGLRAARVDIQRVADGGPDGSEADDHLIRQVFCAVAGDLCRRDAEEAAANVEIMEHDLARLAAAIRALTPPTDPAA